MNKVVDRNHRNRLEFLANALNPTSAVNVLDIGANPLIEGEVSYQSLLDFGLARVVGFEPQKEALEALNGRKSDNETYLPYALGDGTSQTLNLYASQGFSSIFEVCQQSADYLGFAKGTRTVGSAKLDTRRLDELDSVFQPDFIKIDVQGSEKRIFESGRRKMSVASVVQTEVRMFPIYQQEPRYGELEKELVQQGFEFLRFASLKHVSLSQKFKRRIRRSEFAQAVDGDAFFVRDLRDVSAYGEDQLIKLTLIADSIIDNPDLVLFALQQLELRGLVEPKSGEKYLETLPQSARR